MSTRGGAQIATYIKCLAYSYSIFPTHGRICGCERCSPVYITAPPSYISQSLLFRLTSCGLTEEGVDEGLPADGRPRGSLEFFSSPSDLYYSGSEWTDFLLSTRVGFAIQTNASPRFLHVCVAGALPERRRERSCCVRARRGCAAAASEHISGTRLPPVNGIHLSGGQNPSIYRRFAVV